MNREAAKRAIKAILAECMPAQPPLIIVVNGSGNVVVGGNVYIHVTIHLEYYTPNNPHLPKKT